MIQGTGTKTFIVRAGEKLMDGTVKAITTESVVFVQDVNDPLSMVKPEEVRKTVRSADGGRQRGRRRADDSRGKSAADDGSRCSSTDTGRLVSTGTRR